MVEVICIVKRETTGRKAGGEGVEQAAIAKKTIAVEGVDPEAVERLAELAIVARELAMDGAIEAIVAVPVAGSIGGIVADACGKNCAAGLAGLVLHGDANEVHQHPFRLSIQSSGKEGKAVSHAIALEFVVNDGQASFFESADAHAGGLKLRPGEEHHLAVAGAQVSLWSDLGSSLGIHHADLIRGHGKVGKRLVRPVDRGRHHLCVEAGCEKGRENEPSGQKD